MKRTIIYILYAISALLDDVAFYVLSKEDENIGITIETHWCRHLY